MFKHLKNDDGVLYFLDNNFKRSTYSTEIYLAYSYTNKILKRAEYQTWSEMCAKIYLGQYDKQKISI